MPEVAGSIPAKGEHRPSVLLMEQDHVCYIQTGAINAHHTKRTQPLPWKKSGMAALNYSAYVQPVPVT